MVIPVPYRSVQRVYFDATRAAWIPAEDHRPVFRIPLLPTDPATPRISSPSVPTD
mgnify:CR=1 FL=1